ncbi:hypothetical protein GCM10009603_16500 [Nocardiopsis exhalans]
MPKTKQTLPDSLQDALARAYARALREVSDSRGLGANAVHTRAELRRSVLGYAFSELLETDDAATRFAVLFAPVACSREACTNDATFSARNTDEEWCSQPCRQWVRRDRARARKRKVSA